LFGIGLEAYLMATAPEASFTARYLQPAPEPAELAFRSSRGFGHWLGYIGASSMLLVLLYSLRARVGFMRGAGRQSGWLSLHMWLGLVGATLVTYHSAFKLDRWIGLGCFAMWIVILTGAVGRYVYGKVHADIGLADFARNALWRGQESLHELRQTSRAVRVLTSDVAPFETRRRWLLWVMLWEELRDRSLLVWLWLFGLPELADRRQRRSVIGICGNLAALRRSLSYLDSARKMLRYWNWVHIGISLVMFVLAGIHIYYGFVYKAV
jgi:hypothetical protein